MFNRKSIYALNKKDPDAIVYKVRRHDDGFKEVIPEKPSERSTQP